jgi:hypothetical protein
MGESVADVKMISESVRLLIKHEKSIIQGRWAIF